MIFAFTGLGIFGCSSRTNKIRPSPSGRTETTSPVRSPASFRTSAPPPPFKFSTNQVRPRTSLSAILNEKQRVLDPGECVVENSERLDFRFVCFMTLSWCRWPEPTPADKRYSWGCQRRLVITQVTPPTDLSKQKDPNDAARAIWRGAHRFQGRLASAIRFLSS